MAINEIQLIGQAVRRVWIWLLLFAVGIVVGVLYYQQLGSVLVPIIEEMFTGMGTNEDGELYPPLTLAVIIFGKNFVVAAICFLSARITRGILPGIILLYNGVIIGVLAVFMNQEGLFPYYVFVIGLLPHGIIELLALFLACAIGMHGINALGWRTMALPIIMLILAAAIEAWITPLVIALFI